MQKRNLGSGLKIRVGSRWAETHSLFCMPMFESLEERHVLLYLNIGINYFSLGTNHLYLSSNYLYLGKNDDLKIGINYLYQGANIQFGVPLT